VEPYFGRAIPYEGPYLKDLYDYLKKQSRPLFKKQEKRREVMVVVPAEA